MTCKDCIHYDVCTDVGYHSYTEVEHDCVDFKDKSKYIELPCKVGDTVYFITDRNRKYKDYDIVETTVTKLGMKKSGVFFQMDINSMYETAISAFGRNVFLTREEAEKAIEERKNK